MGTADDIELVQKLGHTRETLLQLIAQWNANRLDLFEISLPNDEGEFHGVMRFYFQEAGAKVATKCIRVASSATAQAVIETLVEKFRPDMRMLSIPTYALYEIHENGDERKLEDHEKPLLVQLNWHSDDREGRFLLRRIDEKNHKTKDIPLESSFKRKLSKREKKQLKKLKEKQDAEAASVAEKLYTELPETSFTRSISNPEAVMRRRRQQKLEKKLAQFRSRDGGPDTGGTLKIYGESLCRDVPYKTLLLSVHDTAGTVVKEMLSKYGLSDDPNNYCLVQVCEGEGETILEDDESPLSILMNQQPSRGSIMFHVRRRPSDVQLRKRKKKPGRRAEEDKGSSSGYRGSYDVDGNLEPLLVELTQDGAETGRRIALESEITEVGCNWAGLQLGGLKPRHCVISHTIPDGIVTVTPSSRDADVYVNGQRIYDTTLLHHGTILRLGPSHYFSFVHRGKYYSEREVAENSRTIHQVVNSDGHSHQQHQQPGTSFGTQSPPMSPTQESDQQIQRTIKADSILPATLELPEAGEEGFLTGVIVKVSPTTLQFKLAPTYALYLAARYRATTHFRPDVTPHERAHLLSNFLLRISHILMQVVQERNTDPNSLGFWMANSSEFLHFLKSDRQIGAFSLDAQDVLAEVVQLSFRHLVTCLQGELANIIGHFLLEKDEEDENAISPMIAILTSGMTLLRRCRVNAALTIQLFSQLFHFINMAIFNKLIGMDGRNCCSRAWGNRLRRRLNRVEIWAEKQGLELAADCHLVRVIHATVLLQAPKNTPEEISSVANSCFKLNSLQLRTLLMKYQYESDEIPIPPEIIENIARVTESTVDEVIRSDGRHVRVEEEPLLGLAFLLPEDGYSCDIVRGVPSGLIEFLTPLLTFCRLTSNSSAAGYWTIFFQDQPLLQRPPSAMSGRSYSTMNTTTNTPNNFHSQVIPTVIVNPPNTIPPPIQSSSSNMNMNLNGMSGTRLPPGVPVQPSGSGVSSSRPNEPDIQTIKLHKTSAGLGLSIVAAKGVGQDRLGIYIKSVVKDGSADMDGRLAAGDQLLSVDGQGLVGITQEKAAELLVRTGPVVTLEIARQAAIYQGLATMLSQPSPVLSREELLEEGLEDDDDEPTSSWKGSSEFNSPEEIGLLAPGDYICYNGRISNLRIAQSESSLTKIKSLEALNRRGLSDSALGVPRVIGSSRLLKFFLPRKTEGDLTTNPFFPKKGGGFNGTRRMSERDLPSKILREQNLMDNTDSGFGPHGHGHPMFHQRIQASKSVPSLNTDNGANIPGMNQVQGQMVSPAFRSPGHGDFIEHQQQQLQQHGRPNYSQHYPTMSMTMQPQKSQQMDPHGGGGGTRSRSIQSLSTDPMQRADIGMKQPSTPALHFHQEEDRFYQNVGYYPSPPPPPTNPANMPVRTYVPYSNSTGSIPGGSRHPSMLPRGPPPNLNPIPTNGMAAHFAQQQQVQQQQQWQRSQQQPQQPNQNLLRQEAKMLEMQDELRRREERATFMMNKAQQNYPGPKINLPPSRYMALQQPQVRMAPMGPPPTAPKPYRPGMPIQDQIPPGRPPLPEEYKFSSSELPRGTFTYNNNNINSVNQAVPPGRVVPPASNPWDREEKEREAQRRLEATKYWRDQQIQELEMMGTARNSAQDEQLKALKLERDFQRRAEELNKRSEEYDGADPEEEEEDDRKQMVKRIQEDLERTRLSAQTVHGNGHMNGHGTSADSERARKLEEMRQKKLELAATQAAEDRILREAMRRGEMDEYRRHTQFLQQQQSFPPMSRPSYPQQHHNLGSPTTPVVQNQSNMIIPHQDAPPLPKSPPPALHRPITIPTSPQKKSVSPPQSSPPSKPIKSDKKSVSFNETIDTNEPSSPSPVESDRERVREDPNLFLTEATALLSSPTSPGGPGGIGGLPGNTPGVIGAQEVYRDPRWRRLQQQQEQKQSTTPKPEKLTFKEKMKMFAMESANAAGEVHTPKDKVKTSKAQREIETPDTPITNNNNIVDVETSSN